YILGEQRQSSRLDWAQSSCARWIQLPLFLWITPLLSLGNKRTLVESDLNDLSVNDKCSVLLNRVNRIFLAFPLIMAHIAQPLLIRQIILYIKGESVLPAYAGYLFASALCITAILQAIIHQQIFFRNARIGMRVRNTLSSSIYKHLLTINIEALHKTTTAQTINLVANDASKFEELTMFVHTIVLVPLEALVTFGLVLWYIGLPTIFGYA
ncbi:unnamed protein product, partial [Rotaria magnacalcarata]